jgi:hypothetical protein
MSQIAECHSVLADGTVATITATRRPRANRADVKCSVAGAPALAERMQQVVRLARHTESRYDSREQVVLSIDRSPGAGERDWELAAVLADRMVRGVWQAGGVVHANGWSDQWQLGRIDGHQLASPPALANLILGGPAHLAHLGALSGQPDAAAAVSSARCWFPLHSGGVNDSLCWVEVSVYPLAGAEHEDDAIAVPGLDLAMQLAVRSALGGARQFDARAQGRWRTTVRFGQPRFHGNSFELALVMADRIARGRELLARGRILASGCSSAWHAGRVDTVDGLGPKCALLLAQATFGDRMLLPKAWEAALDPAFVQAALEKGVRVVCIERIGIL